MSSVAASKKQDRGQWLVDDFRKIMADRIKETGLSMTELATESKVGRTYLYRILSGEHVPSLTIAGRIAKALGIEISMSEKS